jgi:hypothetical protein
MRVFKVVLVIFLIMNLFSFLSALRRTRSPESNGSVVVYNGKFGTVVRRQGPSLSGPMAIAISLISAAIWAGALYGTHKRAPLTWELGWVVFAAEFLIVEWQLLASISKIPKTDDPWVAFAAVSIAFSLVTAYWGLWWNRQRSYFTAS